MVDRIKPQDKNTSKELNYRIGSFILTSLNIFEPRTNWEVYIYSRTRPERHNNGRIKYTQLRGFAVSGNCTSDGSHDIKEKNYYK